MVVIYHVFCLINYAGFMLFETQKPEQDRSDKSSGRGCPYPGKPVFCSWYNL